MAMQVTSSATTRKIVNPRVLAQMPVQATWMDAETGEMISANGMTENVGTTSTLVNLDSLPPVGSGVHLKVLENDDTLLEVDTEVIRVERDPSKPLAALNVRNHTEEWQERVWTTAQDIAARAWMSDEDEWIN
ncbi:MAG: hypothetical protein H7Z37_07905 [Pyrinomonadaceae bacterium]|nr:hypothetical protein [Pyrinomonadaceae bacterium]